MEAPKLKDFEHDWEKGGYERFNQAMEAWKTEQRTAKIKLELQNKKIELEDAPF